MSLWWNTTMTSSSTPVDNVKRDLQVSSGSGGKSLGFLLKDTNVYRYIEPGPL